MPLDSVDEVEHRDPVRRDDDDAEDDGSKDDEAARVTSW